jgi:hypothetical protein
MSETVMVHSGLQELNLSRDTASAPLTDPANMLRSLRSAAPSRRDLSSLNSPFAYIVEQRRLTATENLRIHINDATSYQTKATLSKGVGESWSKEEEEKVSVVLEQTSSEESGEAAVVSRKHGSTRARGKKVKKRGRPRKSDAEKKSKGKVRPSTNSRKVASRPRENVQEDESGSSEDGMEDDEGSDGSRSTTPPIWKGEARRAPVDRTASFNRGMSVAERASTAREGRGETQALRNIQPSRSAVTERQLLKIQVKKVMRASGVMALGCSALENISHPI